jgi:hypothetical protein
MERDDDNDDYILLNFHSILSKSTYELRIHSAIISLKVLSLPFGSGHAGSQQN